MASSRKPSKSESESAETPDDAVKESVAPEDSVTPEEEATEPEGQPETAPGEDSGTSEIEEEPADEEADQSEEREEAESAPVAMTGPPPEEEPERRRGGFLPLALGGVVAAALGFGAAQFVPQGWPIAVPEDNTADLQALIAEQSQDIAALRAELAGVDQGALDGRIAALEESTEARADDLSARMGALSDSIAELDARVAEVEKRPIAGEAASEAAVSAYRRELEAVRAELAALTEATAGQIESAEATAEKAALDAAVARIRSALESGEGFADALSEVETLAGVEIPAALSEVATAGIATDSALRDEFPQAARRALAAATQAAVEEGSMSRVEGFVRRQLNARSLEPREGDDADAILSRAEAALGSGELAAALEELGALPAPARAEMAEWEGRARARHDALEAGRQLFAALGGN